MTRPLRMHDVHTMSERRAPLIITRILRRFGFQRRGVTLCAWLTRLPYTGALPQISQERAIFNPSHYPKKLKL